MVMQPPGLRRDSDRLEPIGQPTFHEAKSFGNHVLGMSTTKIPEQFMSRREKNKPSWGAVARWAMIDERNDSQTTHVLHRRSWEHISDVQPNGRRGFDRGSFHEVLASSAA